MRGRPLEGIRIADLTMMWAGPYATKLLGEAGAEIIKVESPKAWDNIRTLVPQDPEPAEFWNTAYYFNEYNHSKKSVTLDLADPAGRELFLELVSHCDVVIENYRAEVLEKLGIGYEVLREANPDIVLVTMAGFGKTGPDSAHVGFGPIIEMMAGLMSLSGYGDTGVPYKTGISYGDPVGGLAAVGAVSLALIRRLRGGGGGHVDLAQREAGASMAGSAFVAASLRGEDPIHYGNRHRGFAPQGCYRALGDDRWVVISVRSDEEWQAVCAQLERPDLSTLSLVERTERHDDLDQVIAQWTSTLSAGEVAQRLQALGVPAGPVIDTKDIHDDPQLVSRSFWVELEHPQMKPYRQSGSTWRFVHANEPMLRHSPLFGEHNDEILGGLLGVSAERMEELGAAGVIGDAPLNPRAG